MFLTQLVIEMVFHFLQAILVSIVIEIKSLNCLDQRRKWYQKIKIMKYTILSLGEFSDQESRGSNKNTRTRVRYSVFPASITQGQMFSEECQCQMKEFFDFDFYKTIIKVTYGQWSQDLRRQLKYRIELMYVYNCCSCTISLISLVDQTFNRNGQSIQDVLDLVGDRYIVYNILKQEMVFHFLQAILVSIVIEIKSLNCLDQRRKWYQKIKIMKYTILSLGEFSDQESRGSNKNTRTRVRYSVFPASITQGQMFSEECQCQMKEFFDFDFYKTIIKVTYGQWSQDLRRQLKYRIELMYVYNCCSCTISLISLVDQTFNRNGQSIQDVLDLVGDRNGFSLFTGDSGIYSNRNQKSKLPGLKEKMVSKNQNYEIHNFELRGIFRSRKQRKQQKYKNESKIFSLSSLNYIRLDVF
ncbi:unnamed protein product [Paramecium primaurelia]|uniref:Uncharacterized protein n=1 Tax=Paramecium primaurelia TaxID=5886 RepID=A0A8S1PP61_PARPR|nr:unnamed protein product [Paramecium primaurelia]